MMTTLNLNGLLSLMCIGVAAPQPTSGDSLQAFSRPADECGDPKMISQAYETLFGTVIAVTEGDMVMIKIRPLSPDLPVFSAYARPNPIAVQFVSIAAPRGSAAAAVQARAELAQLVLGIDVSILISPLQKADQSLTAMLEVAGGSGSDVGQQMLGKGVVKYQEFGPYAIDWWQECHYKLAEARAKSAHLGIWSEP